LAGGRTARNVVANYLGGTIALVLGLVCVPLYLRFMGVGAYGLVGIFAALQSILTILDFGLGATFIREASRLQAAGDNFQLYRIFRAFEAIFIVMAVAIAAAFPLAAPLISAHWVRAESLSQETITHSVALMGLAIAVYWPFSLYGGGLMGLQRMVTLNVIVTAMAMFRSVGSILVLWLVSPAVEAFFIFQVAANLLQTTVTRWYFLRSMPPVAGRVSLELKAIRHLAGFATGIGGTAVLSVLLTQFDKIVLTRFLPLEAFGYYALASTAAVTLYRFATPISNALYPRLTEIAAAGGEIAALYHRSCQLMAAAVLPCAFTVSAFSYEVLYVWTGNSGTAAAASGYLRILMLGTAANVMMYIPYLTQLVYGRSRFNFYVNLVGAGLLVPLLLLVVPSFGGMGAAAVWLLLNVGYLTISVPLMHRFILEPLGWHRNALWAFYLNDLIVPAALCAAPVLALRWLLPPDLPKLELVVTISMSGLTSVVAACLASPFLRAQLWAILGELRRRGSGLFKDNAGIGR
jgi:O-antigen/teichoic acid export membrane protein